jgi:hypothetical protein
MENICSFNLLDNDQKFMTLSPEAHLLYLSAHNLLQHGESQTCLMRDLDVHLLITQNPMDLDVVVNQAVALGWTCAVARSLERAADFFNTPVSDILFRHLAELKPAYEDPSLVTKKQGPGQRWVSVKEKLSRLSGKEKIWYVVQNFFPNPTYMRSRYGVDSHQSIWPYYPYRWFDQSREIARAMGKRLGLTKGAKA